MVEEDLFFGVDVGTTAVKAGLFDASCHALALFSRSYPTQRRGDGVVEQDPRDWTSGIVAAIDAVLTDDLHDRVAAVGLCSQVNTDTFVDANGNALALAIVWRDNRAAAPAAEIEAGVFLADHEAWRGRLSRWARATCWRACAGWLGIAPRSTPPRASC